MKDNVYQEVIQDVEKLLESVCKDDRLKYHIIPVVQISQKIAKELNANIQVVTIAAYLHDITKILGDKEKHHISGSNYAIEFLQKYNIEKTEIELIAKCILNHRGISECKRESIEEKIVATADSIAQFEHPLTFFYSWYGKKQCTIDAGAEGIKNKVQRSWNKIEIDYIKDDIREKYENIFKMVTEK